MLPIQSLLSSLYSLITFIEYLIPHIGNQNLVEYMSNVQPPMLYSLLSNIQYLIPSSEYRISDNEYLIPNYLMPNL